MPNQYSTPCLDWFNQALKSHNSDECLLWPFGKSRSGYGTISFNRKHERVHRLSFFCTYGHWPTPAGLHTCDTPLCFNPRHIIEGDQSRNLKDMYARKRRPIVLTDELAVKIRDEYVPYSKNYSTFALARKYGVSQKTVMNAITR